MAGKCTMIDSVLFFILLTSFLTRLIVGMLRAVWLWQIKEYRGDRMLAHLKETKEGKRFLFDKFALLFWLLLLLSPLAFQEPFAFPYTLLTTAVFVWVSVGVVREVGEIGLLRPAWTVKAAVLSVGVIGGLGVLGKFGMLWGLPTPVLLVFLDRLIFPVVSLLACFLSIPTVLIKHILVFMSKRKIASMSREAGSHSARKNLTVIGVTGSYGKSSTKELIADFLSEKFSVLKTPRSVNSEIGIALLTLRTLTEKHEIFVVEMGAYRRGEIKFICDMLRPKIGVLTGINEQHLSLFGSLENTKRAKMELIEALPSDGLAFFNGDDPIVLETNKTSQVAAIRPARSTFVYSAKQLPVGIKAKNNPFLSNVAAAYFVAKKLGVDEGKLKKKLVNVIDRLGIKVVKKGQLTILDDSFNSNPGGFTTALDVLATYKKPRMIVSPGIIELGSESHRIHAQLGEKIGTIADVVILTNDNFEEPIREGLTKTKFKMSNFLIPKRGALVDVVRRNVKGKTAILFEGRVPNELLITNN